MAERILERLLVNGSAPIDTERLPHGSDYEGHCLPGSHAAGSSSSLCDRILAKDSTCVSPLSDRAIEPTARSTKGRMRIRARQIPVAAEGGNQ